VTARTPDEPAPAWAWGPAAAIGAAVLVGAMLFCLIFGPGLVLAGADYWRSPFGDMANNLSGEYAIFGAPWGFPPTVTQRLLAPHAVSIVYADAIPWLTLLMKALGLQRIFNPLGLFLLLSYLLQPVAMGALLRACGVRRPLALFAGCVLALMFPAWLVRQFGHIALGGQWVILLALALSVASARQGLTRARVAGFAAVAALATGIHAYHLVPVGACFAAALASELAQRGPKALPRVVIAGVCVAASIALSALVLGYGIGQGQLGGPAALGFWSMNLIAPILPQASALFGQVWDGGWFTGTIDPNGGQSFEGYNYLGAGILLLVAVAAGLAGAQAWRARGAGGEWLKRYGPLIAAMLALYLWAVGPVGYVAGHLVYNLPRPTGAIGYWLSGFRCHGRFFWAVGYLLLAAAITQIDRRVGARTLAALAAASLLLQAFDVSQLDVGVHSRYVAPARLLYPPALAASAAIQGRDWVFYPAWWCDDAPIDDAVIAQLSLLAVSQHGSSNSTPTARPQTIACPPAPPPELRQTAAPGDRRITVVLGHGLVSGGALEAFAERTDCRRFLRGLICGAGLDGIAGLEPVTGPDLIARPLVNDAEIRFDHGPNPAVLASGWPAAEPDGVWSDGLAASIVVQPPPTSLHDGLTLQFQATAFPPTPPIAAQHIVLSVGGEMLNTWDVAPAAWATYTLAVPAALVPKAGPLRIDLQIPEARLRPADHRRLGIKVRTLTLAHPRGRPLIGPGLAIAAPAALSCGPGEVE
jgi:general stress protein CsbA